MIKRNATLANELVNATETEQARQVLVMNGINPDLYLERHIEETSANYHYVCKVLDDDDVDDHDHHEHDHHASHQIERYVEIFTPEGPVSYQAYVDSSLAGLDAQENIYIRGTLVGDVFLLHPDTLKRIGRSIQNQSAKKLSNASILLIRVHYIDTKPELDEDALLDELQLAAKFLWENSYGKFNLNTRVVSPVVTLEGTKDFYATSQPWQVLKEARDAASLLGTKYSFDRYNYYAVAIPRTFSGWIGLGYIGQPGVWLNGRFELKVTAHEIGHNVGLRHAASINSLESVPVTYGGSGQESEYGDNFDMMGGGTERHTAFSVRSKLFIGWVSSSQIVNVTTSGEYMVYANDDINSGSKVLALSIPYSASKPKKYYYVEYNRRLMDSKQSWIPGGGLVLRMGYDIYTKGNTTHVLDTTPLTTTQTDAPIFPGQTFYADGVDPLRITASKQECTVGESCAMRVIIEFERDAKQRRLTDNVAAKPDLKGNSSAILRSSTSVVIYLVVLTLFISFLV